MELTNLYQVIVRKIINFNKQKENIILEPPTLKKNKKNKGEILFK